MSEYTPTTERVKRYWLYGNDAWLRGVAGLSDEPDPFYGVRPSGQFDRWLAAHDAEIREQVARALHSDNCPEDPDEGESCSCGSWQREAEIAMDAAWPLIRQRIEDALRGGCVREGKQEVRQGKLDAMVGLETTSVGWRVGADEEEGDMCTECMGKLPGVGA